MTVVLDASAAVRVVMDRTSPYASFLSAADVVIAPDLIVAEICSAFQKYERARILSRNNAAQSVDRALALVDEFHALRDLVPEVHAIALQVPSSVYDRFYLALAGRWGATLLTADRALRQSALTLSLSSPA